jgi:hypothetical protein
MAPLLNERRLGLNDRPICEVARASERPLSAQPRRCRAFRRWSLHNPICRPSPSCDANQRFGELVTYALASRPSTGSPGKTSFMLEIQRSTIDTLVELRWLRADQRDDLTAIVTAFRRFVGRSLDIARNGGGVH